MIRDGVVTEGSHASVIGVLDGTIRTHPTNHLILPGITRAIVLDMARGFGIPVSEEPIAEPDIERLDELFLAGTTTDVMPIVRVNDHPVRVAGDAAELDLRFPNRELRTPQGRAFGDFSAIDAGTAVAPHNPHRRVSRASSLPYLGATGIVTEEATPLSAGWRPTIATFGWRPSAMWVAERGLPESLYYFGRWRGDWARRRWPQLRRFMLRAFKIVRRHPWRSSLAVRWAYGLRLTLPIACGAARLPIPIYLIGSAISCLTWSFAFTVIGWAFGRTTLIVLGHVRRYESYLIAAIVWPWRSRFGDAKETRRRRSRQVLAAGDTGPIPKSRVPTPATPDEN